MKGRLGFTVTSTDVWNSMDEEGKKLYREEEEGKRWRRLMNTRR